MDYKKIKTGLAEYPEQKVNIYLSYLREVQIEKKASGALTNPWFSKITENQYIAIFKKVASKGEFIDGDTITLGYRKKLIVVRDYHAYMNRIIQNYPETIFDFNLVKEGDKFSIKKESGKITYSHEIKDPFNPKRKIIGAFGIIKNRKGEFYELLNLEDISKMKKSSKMSYIWDVWYDRMVLKSIIKRICSVHFKDIVSDIEIIDNEISEPDRAMLSEKILNAIDNADTADELDFIYKENINEIKGNAKNIFIAELKKKKGVLND